MVSNWNATLSQFGTMGLKGLLLLSAVVNDDGVVVVAAAVIAVVSCW